jgi:hypothetical protein
MSGFDDFLRTGVLGPIRVGASRGEISGVLGPPDVIGNPAVVRWPAEMWAYGGMFLQIFMKSRVVVGFGLYFWHPPNLPLHLAVCEIPFTEAWTLTAVGEYLSDREIRHRFTAGVPGEPVDRIIAEEATAIIFDDDGALQKILTFTDRRGSEPGENRHSRS